MSFRGKLSILMVSAAIAFITPRLIGVAVALRRAVMGTANREATVGELSKMKSLVWRAMVDGQCGIRPVTVIDTEGYYRVFPHTHGTDGSFGALLRRVE